MSTITDFRRTIIAKDYGEYERQVSKVALVVAKDFGQYEKFVCDMVDEGMLSNEFMYASHYAMLQGLSGNKVVKLKDWGINKSSRAIGEFNITFFHMHVYTEAALKAERRKK